MLERGYLDELYRAAVEGFVKLYDWASQERVGPRHGHAHAKPSPLVPHHAVNLAVHVGFDCYCALCVANDHFAKLRGNERLRRAVEQLAAKFFFKALQALRERRLRDAFAARSFAYGAVVRDSCDIPKIFVHVVSLPDVCARNMLGAAGRLPLASP